LGSDELLLVVEALDQPSTPFLPGEFLRVANAASFCPLRTGVLPFSSQPRCHLLWGLSQANLRESIFYALG
jgi:hypothetical protein